MKRFLIMVTSVFLISAILSSLFFAFINGGLHRQNNDTYGKLNELINGSVGYDVVFIGSSRINLTVDPRIVDSVLQVNSFNFGLDGTTVVDFVWQCDLYLQTHPKPRLLVLNVDPKMLDIGDHLKVPVSRYLPYISKGEIYDTLSNYSCWPFVTRHFPFLAGSFYNDQIQYQALMGYLAPTRAVNDYYKGFSPLRRVWSNGEVSKNDLLSVCHTHKGWAIFESFLKNLQKSGVSVFVVYGPQIFDTNYDRMHKEYIQRLNVALSSHGIPFIDYADLPICRYKKYFFDATHLNYDGAERYSRKLAFDIDSVFFNSSTK